MALQKNQGSTVGRHLSLQGLNGLFVLSLITLSASVHAELESADIASPAEIASTSSHCKETLQGHSFDVEFTVVQTKPVDGYKSVIRVDGNEIASTGKCFVSNRPSTRFIKCAHAQGDFRIELYPQVETASGKIKTMQAVIWRGEAVEQAVFSHCQ